MKQKIINFFIGLGFLNLFYSIGISYKNQLFTLPCFINSMVSLLLLLLLTVFKVNFTKYLAEQEIEKEIERNQKIEIAVMNMTTELIKIKEGNYNQLLTVSDQLLGSLSAEFNAILDNIIKIIKHINTENDSFLISQRQMFQSNKNIEHELFQEHEKIQGLTDYTGKLSILSGKNETVIAELKSEIKKMHKIYEVALQSKTSNQNNAIQDIVSELDDAVKNDSISNFFLMLIKNKLINLSNSESEQTHSFKEYEEFLLNLDKQLSLFETSQEQLKQHLKDLEEKISETLFFFNKMNAGIQNNTQMIIDNTENHKLLATFINDIKGLYAQKSD